MEEYEKNMVQSALEAGTALARVVKNTHEDGTDLVLVPPGYTTEALSRPEVPFRKKGTVKLSDADSFISYWAHQKEDNSRIYGSMEPAQFLAVFNDYGNTAAQWVDWKDFRALYKLSYSREWDTWVKRNRQDFNGNEAFALWLEDNAIDIVSPDPAQMMDIALNMRVNQSQGFSNATRLQDGTVQLSYSNVVDANAGKATTGGTLKIPETFMIEIPVFEGLDSAKYQVEARFRYRLHSGALTIRYELVRPHKVIELAFKDLVALINEKAGVTVLFGTPE